MKLLTTICILILLLSCADSHKLLRTKSNNIKLDSQKSVYISIPKDGQYGNINYQGSGENISQIILMAFAKYCTNVETGFEYQTHKVALSYSKENNYTYLIFPTILEWEDRATEWSGIPDKASVKISIIEVKTGKTIDSAIIKGKSGLMTFGGDHPQDLLPHPVNNYIKSLYK